ncbi:MAG: TolC family protein [Nannocystaceae bacterium]
MALVVAFAAGGPANAAPAIAPAPFVARGGLSLVDLEAAVRGGSPRLEAAALDVDLAEAEVKTRRTRANPRLDVGWGTIPIGPTNPRDLARPLVNVPNYSIGVSGTVPVGKRRPAITRAEAGARAARAALDHEARAQALDLAEVLGALAVATLRREGMEALVLEGQRAQALAEAALRAKFAAPIEIDRLAIDVERTAVLLHGTEGEIEGELAACADLVARPCHGFEDAREARDFLERWSAATPSFAGPGGLEGGEAGLESRADLRALRAAAEGADAEVTLARAERLPDPTIRVGFLRDQFAQSGAQVNSLNLSVSVPLPILDRGQGALQAARARARRLRVIEAQVIAASRARVDALQRRFVVESARRQRIAAVIVPRAQTVLDDLERAAGQRLVPLTEVVHARRALRELLLQEAEAYALTHHVLVELLREAPPSPEGGSR